MLRNEIDAKPLDWSAHAIQLDKYRKQIDNALTDRNYKLARKLWHEEQEISFEFYKSFVWK